jgi:hypothetical protein
MRQARAAFQPCPPPPSEPEKQIYGVVIHHWKCHRVHRFILVPFDANDEEDPQKVFLCLECGDGVWRRRQGGTGNIIKHIQSRHSGLIVREAASEMAAQHPILGNSRLLGLVLEQYLPFTFADSPRIKGLLSRPTSRKGLAKYADDIARSLETKIADDLQNARTFALVMDEWTDGKNRPFLGVKIHCCIEGPHPGYKAVALAHVPMEERDSDAIAKLAMDVLQRYRLETRVQFVVTDTAKVMSCAVKKKLNMIWWPCWAHILNLMLSDIVTSVKPEGLDWLIALAGRLPRSWHWQKIVTRADQYQIDSVGIYTPTRWYSLTKVVQHSLQLREAIEEFVATEPMGKKKKKKSRHRPA